MDPSEFFSIFDPETWDSGQLFDEEIEIKSTGTEMESYACEKCSKTCSTQQGLERHDRLHNQPSPTINQLQFTQYFHDALKKVSLDCCFSPTTRSSLTSWMPTTENLRTLYERTTPLVTTYKNPEKFLASFYNNIATTMPPNNISRNTYTIVSLEVGIMLLSQIKHSLNCVKPPSTQLQPTQIKYASKELQIITYIGGSICCKLYQRIRRRRDYEREANKAKMDLLLALKVNSEAANEGQYALVKSRDRGGALWLISTPIIDILVLVDKAFVATVAQDHVRKIDSKAIIQAVMRTSVVEAGIVRMREECDGVSREMAGNVVEDIALRYVNARAFSYTKGKRQHKDKALRAALNK